MNAHCGSYLVNIWPKCTYYHSQSRILYIVHLGNLIEARQWIVAQHLSCYNPLSCFTPFSVVKHDKIKFHEFFFFLPLLSLSLFSLSLSLSLLSLIPADHRIGGLICHSLVAWSPRFYIFIIQL